MSAADSRRPRPVTVEDWDDEAQAVLPGTLASAHVPSKGELSSESENSPVLLRYNRDGCDSGYVSRASTVSTVSMASSSRKKSADLKINTAIFERERQPYSSTAARPAPRRQQSPREATQPSKVVQPVKKPFKHEIGVCWVCDKYGYHTDPKKEQLRATSPEKRVLKQIDTRTEESMRPPLRRMSISQTRPQSMYIAAPVQTPIYASTSYGWPPPTPIQEGITYASYYIPPPTPLTPNYLPFQQTYYAEPAAPPQRKALPPPQYDEGDEDEYDEVAVLQAERKLIDRRLSQIQPQRPVLEKRPSRSATLDRVPAAVQQPVRAQSRSHDPAQDRAAMPPPPRPRTEYIANTARPRPGRSATYHENISSNRRPMRPEDVDSDDGYDEVEIGDSKPLQKQRPIPSPTRPPSSYRKMAVHEERPALPQKSKTYHDTQDRVLITSSSRERILPRRSTTTSVPLEKQERDAEAYQRKRGSMPADSLTAENLKSLRNAVPRHIDQRSDAGSNASRNTHHSSSKGSTGHRGRHSSASASQALSGSSKTNMNISVNGVSLSIANDGSQTSSATPVRIDLGGGVHINLNEDRDKESGRHKHAQKQIERPPSRSSNPSRRSLTASQLGNPEVMARYREEMFAIEAAQRDRERDLSRRPSFVDDDEKETLRRVSARSSRQGSTTRERDRDKGEEYERVRVNRSSKRSSVDYSVKDREHGVM